MKTIIGIERGGKGVDKKLFGKSSQIEIWEKFKLEKNCR